MADTQDSRHQTEITMQNQWDECYARQEYIYGTEPNSFLKEELAKLKPGKILFPAEGEGRNAVYAATLGWITEAFDQSTEGQKKALLLANQKRVAINYQIQSLADWNPEPDQYDCIALIFVHMPDGLRQKVHLSAIKALKPGGTLILEAFTINQLSRTSGGPKTADLLFTFELIESDFRNLALVEISEKQVMLEEGQLHQGLAEVIQLVGRKSTI